MDRSDRELVEGAVAGDTAAFECLARRHFRSAWVVALAIVRQPAEAEEVCQDALLRAWERLGQCRHPERVRAWLLVVVRNVAHNRIARERLRATDDLDSVPALVSAAPAADPVRREFLRHELDQAMEGLTQAQRTVLLLSDLEQWSHREIAEDLGISEVMSRRHLSDARRRMRERLAARGVREVSR